MSIKDLVRRKKPAPPAVASSPFTQLRAEMNRLMDNFWTDWPSLSLPDTFSGAFLPKVEVSEADKTVEVTAELPGMTEKDVEVTLSQDGSLLTLKGEKRYEEKKEEKDFHRFERSYGTFQRSVLLPCAVDDKQVEATFKDGVLTMVLPKLSPEAQGIKTIPIKGR